MLEDVVVGGGGRVSMPVYAQPCAVGGQGGYAEPADAKHGLHLHRG